MRAVADIAIMPKRIQRKRSRGWRMPEGAVYVGRPTKWGNPHDWRKYGRNAAVMIYSLELGGALQGTTLPSVEDVRRELRGRDLVCWCPLGEPCHADFLLEIANVER